MRLFSLTILILLTTFSSIANATYTGTTNYSDDPGHSFYATPLAYCHATYDHFGYSVTTYQYTPTIYGCTRSPDGYEFGQVNAYYMCGTVPQNNSTCAGDPAPTAKDCTSLSQTVYSENASIDLGTHELTTASQTKNCVAGCEVMPIDYRISNEAYVAKWWSKLIQGTTHYLISGVVSYSGKSCTSQTAPTDATVTDTCASGDIYIKVAGKSACVTAPSTVKSVAPTITQSPTGTNPKTIQTTTNPVDPSAPSQTTVSTVNFDSSGAISNVSSNTISTVNNTYGQNPTDSQGTDMSGVESKLDSINKSLKTTGTADGKSNGSNTTNNTFYTSKYPNGLTDVMDTASSNLSNSSIGKLTNDLTPNLGDGGTAPSWTWNFNLGKYMNFGSYTLTTDSDLWAILSVIFIITSLFVARRLVFGG